MAAPFPVRTQQFDASIGGVPTAFVLSAYSDRILVIATQLGTLGTVLQARCVYAAPSLVMHAQPLLLSLPPMVICQPRSNGWCLIGPLVPIAKERANNKPMSFSAWLSAS